MIDKRMLQIADGSKKYIFLNVFFQWLALLANAALALAIAFIIGRLYWMDFSYASLIAALAVGVAALFGRFAFGMAANRMGYRASTNIKKLLRDRIYTKLLRLGSAYAKHISTAEAVQLSGEGVEQMEIYFSRYLPQLFYSLLAPLTLFAILSSVSVKPAVALLVCVPLIPASIAFIQKAAKKLLSKYWGEYIALGDVFLENLQGLTTLKIYRADESKNDDMNVQAERFRRVTMKVLGMQLHSATVMDLVAYGGAAAGMAYAVLELSARRIGLAGCLAVILLAADFFIPLRLLGSYFHYAMNGMAASEKIFRLLDLPEPAPKYGKIGDTDIKLADVRFSYDGRREVLHGISMSFQKGLTAIVGESGSGKSTAAALLMGLHECGSGGIFVGGEALAAIPEETVMEHQCMVGHGSYLFKGSVRENLLLADPAATDAEMRGALEAANLWGFLQESKGLDTALAEGAANLSGGQRQRLAIARALLHNGSVYIFDEATSNIDLESENDIVALIHKMAKNKTVILISHRLANIKDADRIYVLDNGVLAGSGTHEELLRGSGCYARLWEGQQRLEKYREGVATG